MCNSLYITRPRQTNELPSQYTHMQFTLRTLRNNIYDMVYLFAYGLFVSHIIDRTKYCSVLNRYKLVMFTRFNT